MAMQSVLEELSEEGGELDRAHIVARVEDWKLRLTRLYAQLQQWLPADMSAHTLKSVRMNEKLMQHYNVEETSLPVLNISQCGDSIATLTPRGIGELAS